MNTIKAVYSKHFDIPLTKTDQAVIDVYNGSYKKGKIKNNTLTYDAINITHTDREDKEPNLAVIVKDYPEEFRLFCLFNVYREIIERYSKDNRVLTETTQ